MSIRKSITMMAGIVLAALMITKNASAQESVWKAAEGVYKYGPGHGFNSMFVVTNQGVVVFDSANSTHSKGMLQAIKNVTDQPVRYVVQSHNHWDHAGGGQVFRDQGATIIAHKEAYDWMKANPHPDLALPDEVWTGKRKDLIVGDTTIELHYVGMSHGLGMTISILPKEKVTYIADIVTPNRVMFTIVPDFNIGEWKKVLSQVETMSFETAIFSHSHAETTFGSMKDVTLTREYIEDLQVAVIAEFNKGTAFEDIPGNIKLEKYQDWAGYDDWLTMNALRVMLDMWMGPYPWRPEPQ
ncbi:MBL fold metallo-hydrolase [Vibrio sp. T187]|uniref:MBL fold metallo-hydrolase n=1 Tax=Vibrio TaxID=662 RepID=UPI0010C94B94|nr:MULTISPECIES: MBL fold metallo-hydrolase [Vibrio]MBW3697790.1 MBL fold metallo-hydrolase [Vibrio sp. T187]